MAERMPSRPRGRAVELLEQNLWSLWSGFGRGPKCRLVDTPEVLAFETPLDRVPYNAVMRFRVREQVEARLDSLLAPYRARGVPLLWALHPTAEPPDLRHHLARRGLAPAEQVEGMIADLAGLDGLEAPAPAPPGIEIAECQRDDVTDWTALVSWRYALPPETEALLQAFYEVAGVGQPEGRTRLWVARRDGVAISKVVLHAAAGVAGIYGVATREEGRGLGLATLLTLRALHAAREQGLSTAVLHSTPMAVSLYRRLGFQPVAPFELWGEPGRLEI